MSLRSGDAWVLAVLAWATLGRAGGDARGDEPEGVAVLRRCVACHAGEDPAGGLDISRRESALAGGDSGPAVVPGDAGRSRIVRRVEAGQMPPKSPLSADQVAALRRWVAAGAEWPAVIEPEPGAVRPGWAWRPLVRPNVTEAGRGPIDVLVEARLRREGIDPAPPADRAVLARRLWLDLIGLPPSVEELESFLTDEAPGAHERLVDRLLASPHHGERWARHWMDAARFSESDGFEYDRLRESAWPYRDYLIRSFNADRPYPEFVRDQIAGDVRPDATADSIAATGFLVAGPWDEANNIQANPVMRARAREEEREDIVAAVAQTFLGLTVNCARCHDHKFDPIPREDYYRFASAFAGVRHGERPGWPAAEVARRDAREASLKGEMQDAIRALGRVEAPARERLRAAGKLRGAGSPAPVLRWSFDEGPDSQGGVLRGRLHGEARVEGGALRLKGRGDYLSAGPLPMDLRDKTLEAWVRLEDAKQGGGSALTVQQGGGSRFDAIVFGERQPRKWIAGSEGFVRTRDLEAPLEGESTGSAVHVAISYEADGSIRLYRDGRPYGPVYRPSEAPQFYRAAESEVLIGLRHTGAGNGFLSGAIEEARVYDRALSEEEVLGSFEVGPSGVPIEVVKAEMTGEERAAWKSADARLGEALRALSGLPEVPKVYAARPEEPGASHVLIRGDVEKRGEPVSARGLSLAKRPNPDFGLAPDAPEAQRRLRLADWIADPSNGLTYRVMANRVWHYHFGVGLVASPNDFGAAGEPPSNPELLDWLACELRDSGGSLKALHRAIVTSDAYKRSSRFDPKAAAKDAESRLLWRFPPRRLEGEVIRDAMLAASGRLNPAIYGPSFRPFTFKVFGSNIYTLTDPIGPEFERRTIYRMHVLSAKSPLLETLDCPDPSTKTPRRGQTTTPLQALSLMNDPFVLRQARAMADRAASEAGEDAGARVDRLYRLALGRGPAATERRRALDLASGHGLHEVAWALLNCSEFVHVE